MFDTEMTTTGMQAEICQLWAVDDDGQNEFSHYIMPKHNITKYASDVNKLELLTTNGQKTLLHKGHPIKRTLKDDALLMFIQHIENI